jgi:hypothetical protein
MNRSPFDMLRVSGFFMPSITCLSNTSTKLRLTLSRVLKFSVKNIKIVTFSRAKGVGE